MNNSDMGADSSAKTSSSKPRSSVMMKSFWGLIGLLAVATVALISMAVMALNEHTMVDKTTVTKNDTAVEIIDLTGNSRMVNGNILPANPLGDDQSVVKTGTETDADDANAEKSALDDDKAEGLKLVEAAKPSTASLEKKVVVAEKVPAEKQLAQATTKAPPVEKSVQHKEANSQMDNLF